MPTNNSKKEEQTAWTETKKKKKKKRNKSPFKDNIQCSGNFRNGNVSDLEKHLKNGQFNNYSDFCGTKPIIKTMNLLHSQMQAGCFSKKYCNFIEKLDLTTL